MIHIEGMGWLGSALGYRLAADGIPFTWHDTDAQFTAWKASTGVVYPAGDDRSQTNLATWGRWHERGILPPGLLIPADYVYRHKYPPHGGRYEVTDLGFARVAAQHGYSVDVPAVVQAARKQFATGRRSASAPGAQVIRAHGFTERLHHVVWGWSAPIRLGLPNELAALPRRPALYSREHRFHIVYAYPIPTRPGWWWAGSKLQRQSAPSSRGVVATGKALDGWLRAFRVLWPTVTVLDVEKPREGWRPCAAPGDHERYADGTMPPLWHSGVRWAPNLIETVVQEARRAAAA